MTWNGKQMQLWYCCRCENGPMLSVNNDKCSMCHIHDRCGSCLSECVQKLTENESKLERERMGRVRALNTFAGNAALHLTGPEEPQQAAQSPLAEPHISWSGPQIYPFSWSAEPHQHEFPSCLLQPAECSDNSASELLPLVYPSLLSGCNLDTLVCVPPVDRSDPLSLTGSKTHPVTTTHWFLDSVQPPHQIKSFGSTAPKSLEIAQAGDPRANQLFTPPASNRKRWDPQGADRDNEENKPFACPFWKRNPLHSWSSSRSCCSNHKRIRDVKQHIYRNHSNQHLTDKTKRRNQGPSGGLTELQYHQLKGYSNRTTTRREQWFAIWDIVFPNLPRPASPYVNHDLSVELDEHQKYTSARDRHSLPALSTGISTPAQTPQDIFPTPGTHLGDLPLFNDNLPLLEDMSADISYMGSLDCNMDSVYRQLLCGQEMTLHGDFGSLSRHPDSIPAYLEQADFSPYHLAPDPNPFSYPCT